MSTRKNKITLIYNSKEIEDRLTLAELKRINEFGFKLREFDVSTRNIPRRATKKLVHYFQSENKQDIIYSSHEDYPENAEEIINSISEDSTILKTPLVVRNGKVEQVDTSYDYIYEEIKINHYSAKDHDEEAVVSSNLLTSIGNLISKQIAYLFLIFALIFGLGHHLINVEDITSPKINSPEQVTDEIYFSDL